LLFLQVGLQVIKVGGWRYASLALKRGFLHGKKTGLDNFMAVCEFGDGVGCIQICHHEKLQ
jgi:hypothetical protein